MYSCADDVGSQSPIVPLAAFLCWPLQGNLPCQWESPLRHANQPTHLHSKRSSCQSLQYSSDYRRTYCDLARQQQPGRLHPHRAQGPEELQQAHYPQRLPFVKTFSSDTTALLRRRP